MVMPEEQGILNFNRQTNQRSFGLKDYLLKPIRYHSLKRFLKKLHSCVCMLQ